VGFPIHRACYRTLDPDYAGVVFVADIDRTYLSTRFSSLRSMARIPFETAAEKKDIAGMARLFREIRRGPGAHSRETPLFFVSASPSQLRPVIEQKMVLDGIGFDGTTFKNWGAVLRRLKLSRLREQIGFKLTALLSGRAELPPGASEILIGDDLETDPLTYALYADILAERIPAADLRRILRLNGVGESDARAIVALRRDVRPGRGVQRAFIRMERYDDPDVFQPYGPGLIGCHGAFQMAVALWRFECVSVDGVLRVASDLVHRGVKGAELVDRLRNLVARGLVSATQGRVLADRLAEQGLVPALDTLPEPDPGWAAVWRRGPERLWTPAQFVGE
jgi:hypothetical protein